MDYREPILALAKTQPILPATVSKAINVNSILAGAMLSELCSKSLLKTSALKIGGSPLYYAPGNESQLLNYIHTLNEKDRKTVELLRTEKIIRETTVDPLTRVSLAQIKDFAYPLIVEYQGTQERFWKWFAVTQEEAETLIRNTLEPSNQPAQKPTLVTPSLPANTVQETLSVPLQKTENIPKPIQEHPSEFWDALHSFFVQHDIKIVEKTPIKKEEYDLVVSIPTPVGNLVHFCKARRKKKITDADLSSAYVGGQLKKLPTIYLIDGELTKKARELLPQLQGLTLTTLHGR